MKMTKGGSNNRQGKRNISGRVDKKIRKPVYDAKTTFVAPPKIRTPKPLAPSTLKPGLVRLEKYMAQMGLASRRESKDIIARSLVLVNGKTIREPGFGINPERDEVTLKGDKMPVKETVLLYKPRGLETSATAPGIPDIRSRFLKIAHLFPVGRLDKDSEGLILLSNDGTITKALTGENSPVGKEYLVTVREEVTPENLHRMADGIILDKVKTKPAIVRRNGRNEFSIVLHEGRKHQIRRMCDACHLTVTSLVRTRIGHLKIGSMKSGNIKFVTPADVERLKNTKPSV